MAVQGSYAYMKMCSAQNAYLPSLVVVALPDAHLSDREVFAPTACISIARQLYETPRDAEITTVGP